MDQRLAFIADWRSGEWTMTELAARYGVSRKTAYKWRERWEAAGRAGLADHSRAPHGSSEAWDPETREAVLAARRRLPHRGPRKLHAILSAREPTRTWPAPSTMGVWLQEAGLSTPRPRVRTLEPLTQPLAAAQAANDVWTADFKGWFRTTDGQRCDPFTLADAYSRFVLTCRIVPVSGAGVRPCFERAFRTYGLPRALRTDNGAPFATTGAGRLSRLAIWWLKLGIAVERIDPGHPEQNGRHERFHLTLQQEAATPPAATPAQQQRRFDRFRRDYNEERPHEALGQRPPATRYTASPRPYPGRLEDPTYEATHQVRRANPNGQIKWQGERIFISEAVRGEVLGLAETDHGDWLVRFMHVDLGRIDRRTRRFLPAWHGPRVGRRR
ncbi:MAG TPA: integrase core domain-containing protein [Rhodocyclaceae bacterium]|nr:integrase core domain-containing protein [Rhodocyclaceae bacterium]